MPESSIFDRWNLPRVLNASGTMTALGASRVVPEARRAMLEISEEFVWIDDLLDRASTVIARLTGAEAGFVTASASSGIALSVAACMTGRDEGRAMRLPDTDGLRDEVVLQAGHLVDYGATMDSTIAVSGARTRLVGSVSRTRPSQIESMMGPDTCAVVFVVSHHTAQYGQVPLEEVVALAHAKSIPVIVDAASEYDLRGFLETGADLVVYSGHKFLGGPTSGIVAGRKTLIDACRLQNLGIGRCMKAGKENIAGAMAALEAWEVRDHDAMRAAEDGRSKRIQDALAGLDGIEVRVIPDPTGNPLERLRVEVDPARAGMTAAQMARALTRQDTPIVVRGHAVERGYFDVDVCNMRDGEEGTMVAGVKHLLGAG